MPVTITHFHVEIPSELRYLTCAFLYYLVSVTTTASIFSLVVMAFDRYFAVVHPLQQIIWFRKAKFSIPVIWLSSLALMAVAPFAYKLEHGKCYYATDDMPRLPFFTYMLLINYVLPLAVISVLYVTVARKIWFHEIPGQQENVQNHAQNEIPKKKVVRMLIIVVIVFAVCWLPLQVFQMDYAVRAKVSEWPPLLIYFSYWFSQANSGINPWLYIGLNGKMKAAFSKMVRCRRRGNIQGYKASTSTARSHTATGTQV